MTDNHDPLTDESQPGKEKSLDQKTEDKVHHHLTNAKDVISEEDIKNIRTDLGEDQAQGLSEEELKKAEEVDKLNKKDDDDDDHPFVSSYNILGS